MATIIRGTTPTLIYNFDTVSTANLAAAFLTLTNDDGTVLEKTLETATIEAKSLAWTLTQEETLAFGKTINAMLNYKLNDGTRGASKRTTIAIAANDKAVAI